MPRTRPPYPPEFREEAVRLARSSKEPLSRIPGGLGVSAETLGKWVRQTKIDHGEREGLSTEEREELGRLRKENRLLREEREILKKARRAFAKPSSPGRATRAGDALRADRGGEGQPSSGDPVCAGC